VRIDAHQHFWSLALGGYDWLTPELTALYRDFTPNDLTPLLKKHKIEGTVLVQASPTLAETQYLLTLADQHRFIKGVVGWVDFEDTDAVQAVTDLASHPRLVGLRPMIQDIDDINWMLTVDFIPVFNSMIESDLVFDALVMPDHLPNLRMLLQRHPELKTVIDHASKPDIAAKKFEPWATEMALIAKESKAFIKLSGLVTQAQDNWATEDLLPYIEHIFSCFGANRIIWGSDWPVCNLMSDYTQWYKVSESIINQLSAQERAAIFGENAVKLYSLKGCDSR